MMRPLNTWIGDKKSSSVLLTVQSVDRKERKWWENAIDGPADGPEGTLRRSSRGIGCLLIRALMRIFAGVAMTRGEGMLLSAPDWEKSSGVL